MKNLKILTLITSLLLAEASFAHGHGRHHHRGGNHRTRAARAAAHHDRQVRRTINHINRATMNTLRAIDRATHRPPPVARVIPRAPIPTIRGRLVGRLRVPRPAVIVSSLRPIDRELLNAARGNYPRRLEKALNRGAFINATQPNGQTALHLAAKFGNKHCIKILLRRGANRYQLNGLNNTPAQVAMNHGRVQAANLIRTFF